jgi:hypothetical protein
MSQSRQRMACRLFAAVGPQSLTCGWSAAGVTPPIHSTRACRKARPHQLLIGHRAGQTGSMSPSASNPPTVRQALPWKWTGRELHPLGRLVKGLLVTAPRPGLGGQPGV